MGTGGFEDDDMVSRNTLLAAAVAGLVGAGAAAASAQDGPGGPGGWHHGGAGGLLEGVTLNDDQKAALHALMQGDRAATKPLRQQMQALHQQIDATLLSSGTVTAATLAPLVQQQESLMQQLDAQRIAQQIAIRNLLTPAQLAQAAVAQAQLTALRQQERTLRAGEGTPPE